MKRMTYHDRHITSCTSRPTPSCWQSAYRRYRELETTTEGPLGKVLPSCLRAAAESRQALERWLQRYEAAQQLPEGRQLPVVPTALLNELYGIADLRSSYSTEAKDFIFEDVYHLAFDRLARWRSAAETVPPANDCFRLFRGQQNDTWPIGPKVYRRLPEGEGRAIELKKRAAAACAMGSAIASRLGIPFEEGMAIAQHYSGPEQKGELGVPTWMMDFTRDPWVALFFATDGAVTGERGVVWSISPTEYSRHVAGAVNRLGSLQVVVPPNVPRIHNQSGVFVVASHPAIFAQYVPFGVETRFHQFTGLTFEDPVLGIRHDTIYPPDDPWLTQLKTFRSAVGTCACQNGTACHVPVSLVEDPSDPEIYVSALTSWQDQMSQRLGVEPEGVRPLLPLLAQYHALLQTPRYAERLCEAARSINRMESAFDILTMARLGPGEPSLYEAVMRAYVEHSALLSDRTESTVLLEAMNELGITREFQSSER